MQPPDEVSELRDAMEKARRAVLKLKGEILAVLEQDIERFPMREVRRRFMSAPEFAESLGDDQVARLKSDIESRTPGVRDRVIEAMKQEDRWFDGVSHDGPARSLSENARLWEPTSAVVDLVREVLRANGFPNADDPPVEYKMPTYFVSGKYLPTLAERYWRLMGEIRELQDRIREVEARSARESLGRRWDRIEPLRGVGGLPRTDDNG